MRSKAYVELCSPWVLSLVLNHLGDNAPARSLMFLAENIPIIRRKATSMFDYETENIDEHCFSEGEEMYVKEAPEDPGWYAAHSRLIPCLYCAGP